MPDLKSEGQEGIDLSTQLDALDDNNANVTFRPKGYLGESGLLGDKDEEERIRRLNVHERNKSDVNEIDSMIASESDKYKIEASEWRREVRYRQDLFDDPSISGQDINLLRHNLDYAKTRHQEALDTHRKYESIRARNVEDLPGTAIERGYFRGMGEIVKTAMATGQNFAETLGYNETAEALGDIRGAMEPLPSEAEKNAPLAWSEAKGVSGVASYVGEKAGGLVPWLAAAYTAPYTTFAYGTVSGQGDFRRIAEEHGVTDKATLRKASYVYGTLMGGLMNVVPWATMKGLTTEAKKAFVGTVTEISMRVAARTYSTTTSQMLASGLASWVESYGISDASGKKFDFGDAFERSVEAGYENLVPGLLFGLTGEGHLLAKGGYVRAKPGDKTPGSEGGANKPTPPDATTENMAKIAEEQAKKEAQRINDLATRKTASAKIEVEGAVNKEKEAKASVANDKVAAIEETVSKIDEELTTIDSNENLSEIERAARIAELNLNKSQIVEQLDAAKAEAQAVAVQPINAEPPTPEGHTRFYHGGHENAAKGDVWFTTSREDAEGWAGRHPDMKVAYVDVPNGDPRVDWGDIASGVAMPSRQTLPDEIASKRTSLVDGAAIDDLPMVREWAKEKYGAKARVFRLGQMYSIDAIGEDGNHNYVTPDGGVPLAKLSELGYERKSDSINKAHEVDINESYDRFISVLRAGTVRTEWVNATGVTPDVMSKLVDAAVKDGYLRIDNRGVPRLKASKLYFERNGDTPPVSVKTEQALKNQKAIQSAVDAAVEDLSGTAVKAVVKEKIELVRSRGDEMLSVSNGNEGRASSERVFGQKPSIREAGGKNNEIINQGFGRENSLSTPQGSGIASSSGGAIPRILKSEAATIRKDGTPIIGRRLRGKGKSGEGDNIQSVGTTRRRAILHDHDALITADKVLDSYGNDIAAALSYAIFDKGKAPVKGNGGHDYKAKVELKQHNDGAWEVSWVEVKGYAQKEGLATRIYEAIEKDLGINHMSPSGELTDNGFAFWSRRSPESVMWHQQSPIEKGMYYSPRFVKDAIARITRGIKHVEEKTYLNENDKAELRKSFDEELRMFKEMWRRLPGEAKASAVTDQMFSLRGFYSPAIRAVESMSANKGTGEQFWKQITKAGGVRKDELDWMGLGEFLAGKKSVTKAEILEFMRENQVKVDEIIDPHPPFSEDIWSPFGRYGFNYKMLHVTLPHLEGKWTDTHAALEKHGPIQSFTRIWELPTKGTAKEFTEDHDAKRTELQLELAKREAAFNEKWNNTTEDTYTEKQKSEYESEWKKIFKLYDDIETLTRREEGIRRVLGVGDVQSALHQRGRAEGYMSNEEVAEISRVNNEIDENRRKIEKITEEISSIVEPIHKEINDIYEKHRLLVDKLDYVKDYESASVEYNKLIKETEESLQILYKKINDTSNPMEAERDIIYKANISLNERIYDLTKKAPNAPYKGTAWIELAMKQVLRYAVENGFDEIQIASSKEMSSSVGMTEDFSKLMYDNIIPNFLKKYIKKWNASVENVTGEVDIDKLRKRSREINEVDPGRFSEWLPDGATKEDAIKLRNEINEFVTLARLSVEYDKVSFGEAFKVNEWPTVNRDSTPLMEAVSDYFGDFNSESGRKSITITSEMRASVLEGQPLSAKKDGDLSILGKADPENLLVYVASKAIENEAANTGRTPVAEAVRTVRHEVMEIAKAIGLITEKEWSKLIDTARRKGWIEQTKVREAYEEVYKGKMSPNDLEAILLKEAIFEKMADFESSGKKPSTAYEHVYQRFIDFIRSIGRHLRGMAGVESADDIFHKFDTGELRRRFEALNVKRPDTQAGTAPAADQLLAAKKAPPRQPSPVEVAMDEIRAELGMHMPPPWKGSKAVSIRQQAVSIAQLGGEQILRMHGLRIEKELQPHADAISGLSLPGSPQPFADGFMRAFSDYVLRPDRMAQTRPELFDAMRDVIDATMPHLLDPLDKMHAHARERVAALKKEKLVVPDVDDVSTAAFIKKIAAQSKLEMIKKPFSAVWDTYKKTFQTELFGPRALESDAAIARMNSATAQEKDALYHAEKARIKQWNKMPMADRMKYLRDIEIGAAASTPELAESIRLDTDRLHRSYSEELKFGSKASYIEDYFPHIFKYPRKARAWMAAKAETMGADWFQKHRHYDLINEALAAGLELKSTNPAELVMWRLMAGVDMRNRVQLMFDLKEINTAVESATVGNVGVEQLKNAGWIEVKAPNQDLWMISPEIQPLWKNAISAKGLWQAEGISGDIFKTWMAYKNFMVPIKLAVSLFHATHVWSIAFADRWGLAYSQLTRNGDFVGAMKTIATSPWAGQRGGYAARKAWEKPKEDRTSADNVAVWLMNEGGMVPHMSEEMKAISDGALGRAFGQGQYLLSLPLAARYAVQKMQSRLFENWIPGLKAESYLAQARVLLEQKPELLTDTASRRVALRSISKSVDNRFGEMFYKNLFWNKTLKDVGIASFLSLGWQTGFFREFGGSVLKSAMYPFAKKFSTKGDPYQLARDSNNKIAFVLAYTTTSMMMAGAMTFMYTGEIPEGYDLIFPRIGGKNPDGTDRRVTTPFFTREAPMFMKHMDERGGNAMNALSDMMWNKMLFQPFMEFYRNRNYWGYEIADEEAPWYKRGKKYVEHAFKEMFSPITIAGAKQAKDLSGLYDDTILEAAIKDKSVGLSFLGFSPAPAYAERSAMENHIRYLYQQHKAPLRKPYEAQELDEKKRLAKQKLRRAILEGNDVAAQEAKQEAIEAGSSREALTKKKLNTPSGTYLFSQLPEADQRMLLKNATPEERKLYRKYATKRVRAEFRAE